MHPFMLIGFIMLVHSRVSTEKDSSFSEKKGHLGRLMFFLIIWSVWILLKFPDNQWSKGWSLRTARQRLCCHTFWIRQLAPIWMNFKRLTMLWTLCIKCPSIYLDIFHDVAPHLGGFLLPECVPTWMSGVKLLDTDAVQARVILL